MSSLLLLQGLAELGDCREWTYISCFVERNCRICTDLGTSIDLKSSDKELKAVTPEKSKACVTAFTKKLVTTLQL